MICFYINFKIILFIVHFFILFGKLIMKKIKSGSIFFRGFVKVQLFGFSIFSEFKFYSFFVTSIIILLSTWRSVLSTLHSFFYNVCEAWLKNLFSKEFICFMKVILLPLGEIKKEPVASALLVEI